MKPFNMASTRLWEAREVGRCLFKVQISVMQDGVNSGDLTHSPAMTVNGAVFTFVICWEDRS